LSCSGSHLGITINIKNTVCKGPSNEPPFFILELSTFLYWSYLPFLIGVTSLFYIGVISLFYIGVTSLFYIGVISLFNIKKGDNSNIKREVTPIEKGR
jgi:hypothetical protein